MRNSQEYMQQAIDKASRLIQLLKKQNQEIKSDNKQMQISLQKITRIKQACEDENKTYKVQQKLLKQQLLRKQSQIGQMKHRISSLQTKIEQKSSKSQHLHQKIAQLTGKLQSVSKSLQKEKKKNLSIENQNQYLFKKIEQHKSIEKSMQNCQNQRKEEFLREIQTLQRTKQAFCRKWEELKQENCALRVSANESNLKCSEIQRRYQIALQKLQKLSVIQNEVKQTNDVLSYIIESTLKVKAEDNLFLKVEQIKNFMGYRLQHIQNLLRPIFQYFQKQAKKDIGSLNITDLENISSLANRLINYITELIK